MNKEELRQKWDSMKLSCRISCSPERAKDFCKKVGVVWKPELVYTQNRYREISNGQPRVDCEDLLIHACEELGIEPNQERIELSEKMFGEGSRRQCVEEAYLEVV